MEQVRIRNKEREERLRVRAAILDRIRLKSQESTDFKKLQEEGLAKVMSNPSINTYRNMKILKYAYSGRPNLLKLISLLGVYRRQKKREAEIKYRSAQKLKRERFKFFKKSKNRQNIRTLSVKTRRRKVNVGLCVSATSPFAGNMMWLDDIRISSSPATKFIPLSSSKKFHKISTHLKIVGSYRLYNLIQRRMRTKEKNLTILRRYRRTGEKRSRPRIV